MRPATLRLVALILLLGLPFLLPPAHAATVGQIRGTVRDADSGEPIPNANVVLVGTRMGASADSDGRFFIINVPAGTYNLRATSIGFTELSITGVRVAPDFTTDVDFEMTKGADITLEGIEVGAEKPMIQRDQTGTTRFLDAEDLQNQPVRGYQEAASLQAGVVASAAPLSLPGGGQLEEATTDPRLYIRGGRSNETAYFVDGFSQQDPLTGISTANVNQNAIEQVVVMTGGFDAEYGRIMSGAVNVVTREGSDRYFGTLEAATDNVIGNAFGESYDYNLYALSLGGPVPGVAGLSFLASGERRWEGDRTPRPIKHLDLTDEHEKLYEDGRLPNNTLDGYSWQGKFSWSFHPEMKVRLGAMGSRDLWQEYRHAYLFDISHTPKYEDTNRSFFGTYTHTLSPTLFYEVSGNWFYTERYRGDGVHFKNLQAYGIPEPGNPQYDPNLPLFYYGDSLRGGHVWDDFLHRESSYIGGRVDVTDHWSRFHTAKLGMEYRRHTLRRYNHLFPVDVYKELGAYTDADFYGYSEDSRSNLDDGPNGAKHPIDASVYLQNKYERDDVVVRAGLRYDYLDARTDRVKDASRPLGSDNVQLDPEDLEDSEGQHKVSPRVGIGFPIAEQALFHANWGKFFQQPNLEDLYVNYDYLSYKVRTGGYFYPFGNPNLEPEETTAYELGVTRQLSSVSSLDITAFYKDVRNLVQVVNIPASPNAYASFRNTDYGTVKGVDVSFDLRRTNNIQAAVYYTLSWAKGTGSASQSQRNIAWTASNPPKLTSPLDFDQRHKLTLNLDWRLPENGGPTWGGRQWLERTGVNVLFNIGSGFPYTPTLPYDEITLASVQSELAGSLNSRNAPWTFRIDAKADRGFTLGGVDLTAYVWVLNLLDRRNPVTVYGSTGDVLSTGYLATPSGESSYGEEHERRLYELKQRNPNNFDIPRMVRVGLRSSF